MKKPSAVTLSVKLYYKSLLLSDESLLFLSNVSIRVLGSIRFQLYIEFF